MKLGRLFAIIILVALMAAAALSRTESRGVHARSDFPDTDPAQTRHTVISLEVPAE